MDLTTSVTGIVFKHPVMNASGILAASINGVRILAKTGVAGIVTKTLTLEPREGYLPPITIPLDYGLLNAVGLANPGIDAVNVLVEEIHRYGLPAIVSIGGRDPGEFQVLAEKALDAKPEALELNLSCPHTPGFGVDAAATDKALKHIALNVSSISSIPVWGKLGFSRRIVRESEILLSNGVDAVVLINTLPGMFIDVYVGKPVLTHGYGGLSGPAIHPVAVYSVYKVYEELGAEIIGVGGVVDWKTCVELLLAGAKAVQIGTGFYMVGYDIVHNILDGVKKYMEEKGFSRISDIIGYAHRK
ncbi:dihydroorotate dehydrogenase [Staphylothermus hellenicus]|uniref:Dihydroorotate dehydrogenase n=1 Tax=Staphylothermus hellenicus (strain DSM 12710 / JCM 10830 / BK20S6-10-b1 / P8) TaxID=591019 RepID=D7DB07_STAHD|nr:dihydroorotate dehydrogenase [Staphylothermus hellenicus]ADI31354.1 dihydroorotate dehydrogenase family protein [Staphylothermus hellenicus DSM 12710]